jgi:hypothetical protein
MAAGTFGTAINCIDGRFQTPVAEWLRARFGVQYVDTVTVPGPDGVLTRGTPEAKQTLQDHVRISQQAHKSEVVVVAGHFDCAGFPATPEEHKQAIRQAAAQVAGWGLPMRVIGLWVNDGGQVEVLSDSASA